MTGKAGERVCSPGGVVVTVATRWRGQAAQTSVSVTSRHPCQAKESHPSSLYLLVYLSIENAH